MASKARTLMLACLERSSASLKTNIIAAEERMQTSAQPSKTFTCQESHCAQPEVLSRTLHDGGLPTAVLANCGKGQPTAAKDRPCHIFGFAKGPRCPETSFGPPNEAPKRLNALAQRELRWSRSASGPHRGR